jgi:hypothetical protein
MKILLSLRFAILLFQSCTDNSLVVNDITGLNEIIVKSVHKPTTIKEISNLIKSSEGSISIGGSRSSMGG